MNRRKIETAPKDGSVIEVFHDTYPGGIRAKWEGGEWVALPRNFTLGPDRYAADPTHWMPASA
jgi:hypothetical protein